MSDVQRVTRGASRLILNGEVILGDESRVFRFDNRDAGRVVLTMGTFDLFHAGHVFLLEECRKIAGAGGRVVVALNSDEFASRFKDAAPTHTLHQRMRILGACRHVDEVIENVGNEDAKAAIGAVNPDFLVIGQDWALKDYYTQLGLTQYWLDDMGVSLLYVPRPVGAESSTEVRRRVRNSGTR